VETNEGIGENQIEDSVLEWWEMESVVWCGNEGENSQFECGIGGESYKEEKNSPNTYRSEESKGRLYGTNLGVKIWFWGRNSEIVWWRRN